MILKINNAKKRYPAFELDCSMEVHPGEIVGLIGKNGAGKSTTFSLTLGLDRLDGGEIELFGKPIQELDDQIKQKLGVVLSDSTFNGNLTIQSIQNILKAMYPKFQPRFFEEKVKAFELPRKQAIRTFSTGVKAKLNILIALSHQAEFLILDEPTSGLDAIAREEILDMLRSYMEEDPDRSILISSHISSDLETLCDQVFLIDQGKMIFHSDMDTILSKYGILKVSPSQFETMDKSYLVKVKDETFGKVCLVNEKQYYLENEPELVVENANLDTLFTMYVQGESK